VSERTICVCACCGDVFVTTVTDEEAMLEFTIDFPDENPADVVTVCDDCYEALTEKRTAQ